MLLLVSKDVTKASDGGYFISSVANIECDITSHLVDAYLSDCVKCVVKLRSLLWPLACKSS